MPFMYNCYRKGFFTDTSLEFFFTRLTTPIKIENLKGCLSGYSGVHSVPDCCTYVFLSYPVKVSNVKTDINGTITPDFVGHFLASMERSDREKDPLRIVVKFF